MRKTMPDLHVTNGYKYERFEDNRPDCHSVRRVENGNTGDE